MSTAEATDVRTLLADYADNPKLMPNDASVGLTFASDGWEQTLPFGDAVQRVTCRIGTDDLNDMIRGRVSEVYLLASGQMSLIGSSTAINALFDVLPAFGRLLAGDLEMGGHRFCSVRGGKALPSGCPDPFTDDLDNQHWAAALVVSRLSRRCQMVELERLIPRASKLDYPGIADWQDVLARIFASVAGDPKKAQSRWGTTANLGVDDSQSNWRTWTASAAAAPRPLRASAATLDLIEPLATTPSAR